MMNKLKLDSGMIYEIPQSEIAQIGYFSGGNEDIRQIHTRLKSPDILFNCEAFDICTGAPLSDVVSNGKIQRLQDRFGMAFDGEKAMFSLRNSEKAQDYIGFCPMLVQNGTSALQNIELLHDEKCGRTAIAVDNGEKLYIALVPHAYGMSLKALTNALLDAGAHNGGCLNSGASSQWITPGGEEYTGNTSRGVIAIWLRDNNTSRTVNVRSVLNIRAAAPNAVGMNLSPIIGTYQNRERVIVLEQKAGWCRTVRGWVFSGYLSK